MPDRSKEVNDLSSTRLAESMERAASGIAFYASILLVALGHKFGWLAVNNERWVMLLFLLYYVFVIYSCGKMLLRGFDDCLRRRFTPGSAALVMIVANLTTVIWSSLRPELHVIAPASALLATIIFDYAQQREEL